MDTSNLEPKDEETIKTLCEFLLFDQYQESATYSRFEQCFQPLLNDISISLVNVFKDICGDKKKYITYKRFAKAYIQYKNNQNKSEDIKIFFEKITQILKDEESFVGITKENCYIFNTKKSCGKREAITKIEILSDKEGGIHGINLEYDRVIKSKMYPKTIEGDLYISLEMLLGIVDDKPIKDNKIGKFLEIKTENFLDAVTHVFGTVNPKT